MHFLYTKPSGVKLGWRIFLQGYRDNITAMKRVGIMLMLAVLLAFQLFTTSTVNAAVSTVGSASQAANSDNITITTPSGTAAGDVILFGVNFRADSASYSCPSGYSSNGMVSVYASGGSGTITYVAGATISLGSDAPTAIYRTIVPATPPASYNFYFRVTCTEGFGGKEALVPASVKTVAGATSYRGVYATTPIDVHGTASGSGTAISAPSVTTTVPNTRVVGFFSINNGGSITAPTGTVSVWSLSSSGGASSTRSTVLVADYDHSAAAATGSKTATASSTGDWSGIHIALRPAPVPLNQSSYRWFENADSITPGSPLAPQDSAASVPAETAVRLRGRLATETMGMANAEQNFKLQYAEKSGTCDIGFSGEVYSDVEPPSSAAVTAIAGSGSTVSAGGFLWSSPDNITADDGQNAFSQGIGESITDYLVSSSHGFAIPSGATIEGIELIVDRTSLVSAGSPTDYDIRLMKGGVATATNKSINADWNNGSGNYGGPTDLWGESWIPADINASNFGARIGVYVPDQATAYVDYVAVKVYYSVPVSGPMAFHDNALANDGTPITSTANDPLNGGRTAVYQTYIESNPFTNSNGGITTGSDGLWDFSIRPNAAAAGKSFCFRAVNADNSLLSSYSYIPELTVESLSSSAPTLDQQMRGGQSVVGGQKQPFSW